MVTLKQSKQDLVVFLSLLLALVLYFWLEPLFSAPLRQITSADYFSFYYQALSQAHFPVVWIAQAGAGSGSPFGALMSPLPALLASPFLFLGITAATAISILAALSLVLSAWGWFKFSNRQLSPQLSLFTTLAILLCQLLIIWPKTYSALTLAFSVTLLPFLLHALFAPKATSQRQPATLTPLLTLITLTNLAFALALLPGVALVLLKQGRWRRLFSTILLTFIGTAFFTFPLLATLSPPRLPQFAVLSPPGNFFTLTPPSAEVTEAVNKAGEKYLQLNHKDTLVLTFNVHDYPGWTATINDLQVTPTTTANHQLQLTLDPNTGEHKDIRLTLTPSPLVQFASTASLFALLTVLFIFIYHFTHKHAYQSLGILAATVLTANIFFALVTSDNKGQVYDPVYWEKRYLESQWVNPMSKHPIGDHGLYTWAGWAYVHGENPILINGETPPLGKYFIG